jgi:hypothetical protein
MAGWWLDGARMIPCRYEITTSPGREPHDLDAALDAVGLLTWPTTPRAPAPAYRRGGARIILTMGAAARCVGTTNACGPGAARGGSADGPPAVMATWKLLADLDYRPAPWRNHRARAAADARCASHSRDELAGRGSARMTVTRPAAETLPGCSAATAASARAFA